VLVIGRVWLARLAAALVGLPPHPATLCLRCGEAYVDHDADGLRWDCEGWIGAPQ
jgi:hypothetical protein